MEANDYYCWLDPSKAPHYGPRSESEWNDADKDVIREVSEIASSIRLGLKDPMTKACTARTLE